MCCCLCSSLLLPDAPACHDRRVITGEYVKHNSNSGYVEAHRRATPQTFSHWTFEASNGRLMVVDIQGVSDLYTDPQVHTLEGKGYGEGNLGAQGFALFFANMRSAAPGPQVTLSRTLSLTPRTARAELHPQSVTALAADGARKVGRYVSSLGLSPRSLPSHFLPSHPRRTGLLSTAWQPLCAVSVTSGSWCIG